MAGSRSVVNITNQSKISSQIDQAVQRDREMFQRQMEICERTREKEAKMVEKIMWNEEVKNQKMEENAKKYEDLRSRERQQQMMIQMKLKQDSERRIQEEIKRERDEASREKQDKKLQWMKFMEKLRTQREIDMQLEIRKRQRQALVQEREKLRQEKFLICVERNEHMMQLNRQKMEQVKEKHHELIHKLEERKMTQ